MATVINSQFGITYDMEGTTAVINRNNQAPSGTTIYFNSIHTYISD